MPFVCSGVLRRHPSLVGDLSKWQQEKQRLLGALPLCLLHPLRLSLPRALTGTWEHCVKARPLDAYLLPIFLT